MFEVTLEPAGEEGETKRAIRVDLHEPTEEEARRTIVKKGLINPSSFRKYWKVADIQEVKAFESTSLKQLKRVFLSSDAEAGDKSLTLYFKDPKDGEFTWTDIPLREQDKREVLFLINLIKADTSALSKHIHEAILRELDRQERQAAEQLNSLRGNQLGERFAKMCISLNEFPILERVDSD